MCVRLVLVTAGCILFQGLSGATSVFCEHHLLVGSCSYRLYLFLVLVFVAGCLCSQSLSGATSFWDEAWNLFLWPVALRTDVSGSHCYHGVRRCPKPWFGWA